jgi:hypothetical protein
MTILVFTSCYFFKADVREFALEDGDMLALLTDGVLDNLFPGIVCVLLLFFSDYYFFYYVQICPVAFNVTNNLSLGIFFWHLSYAGGQILAVIFSRYEERCTGRLR